MKAFLRAGAGCLLVFVVHLPRLIFQLLLVSYAAVFNNRPTLTANPKEHIKRARKILKRGRLSEMLYAALELRFALERMSQRDLVFATEVSSRMLDEPNPVKKLANLHRIAPTAKHAHEVYFVDGETGQRSKWADYRPLDRARVARIHGRLGDLLHPKDGLSLGVPDDTWYVDAKSFLLESLDYLSEMLEGNSGFFDHDGLDQFEIVVTDEAR